MPGGPIAVFDNSALQSLSVDESVFFDNFYLPVVTPLFFVETLADLEKSVRKGHSAEEVVGIIAAKTPVMNGAPNVHHLRLVQHELLGDVIKMDHRPVVGEARRVITGDQRGIVVEQLPEMEAFQRWQEGSFLDLERLYVLTGKHICQWPHQIVIGRRCSLSAISNGYLSIHGVGRRAPVDLKMSPGIPR